MSTFIAAEVPLAKLGSVEEAPSRRLFHVSQDSDDELPLPLPLTALSEANGGTVNCCGTGRFRIGRGLSTVWDPEGFESSCVDPFPDS